MRRCILLTITILLSVFMLCGCQSANTIYRTVSDSYELSDDELKALTEGKLALNLDAYSDLDIDGTPGDISTNVNNLGKKAKTGAYIFLSGICSWTKHYGIGIALVSIFIGIVIMRLARKSINIRRKAFFVLILLIPILIIALMYGSAIVADSML